MKHITILIVHNALVAAIGNTHYLFNMVNSFLEQAGKPALFEVSLVGLTKRIKLNEGLYSIQADATLNEIKETNLIVIPPMSGKMESGISLNKQYLPWINHQYKKGAEVASLCVGAFLLAETGLLNGRKCSTHWQTANEFRKRFPDVHLVDDKIITDYKGLYTSGGSNSYWNLLIYLIRKYTGPETALLASKYFEVEIHRNKQSPFMIFEGCKYHDDALIHAAQKHMETHYQGKLTIGQLAARSNLSPRTFQRRFKKVTHFTVATYLQKVRIEAAKKLLETNAATINEVMFEAGYNDPKAFRNAFKKVAGMTPLAYKGRFSLLY